MLDNLTLEDVRVVVDLTGLTPGTYQVNPRCLLLSDRLRYENILPGQIEVIIAVASPTGGTPTPTATFTPTITPTPTRPSHVHAPHADPTRHRNPTPTPPPLARSTSRPPA